MYFVLGGDDKGCPRAQLAFSKRGDVSQIGTNEMRLLTNEELDRAARMLNANPPPICMACGEYPAEQNWLCAKCLSNVPEH